MKKKSVGRRFTPRISEKITKKSELFWPNDYFKTRLNTFLHIVGMHSRKNRFKSGL